MTLKGLQWKQILIAVSIIIVILLLYSLFCKKSTINDITQQKNQVNVINPQSDTRDIEEDAIETYLYMTTLQFYQLAQAAGVESKEYRDYEQKYAEYRTFRDARVRRMLERFVR